VYFTSDAFAETSGLVCSDVVNLSGDSEAVLGWIRPNAEYEEVFVGNSKTARASIIGFKIKTKQMAYQQNSGGDEPTGLPIGTIVRSCGCWGYNVIGRQTTAPTCASEVGEAVACKFLCRGSGAAWEVRCL
jgi:hypothetical protein